MKNRFKFKLNWEKCNNSEDYMPIRKALISKGFCEKTLILKYNGYISKDGNQYRWDIYSEVDGEENLVDWCNYYFDSIKEAQTDLEEFWVHTVMEMFSEGTLTKH